ncbi:hypothetical protein [Rubritalea marina]|uniref:hypothetical protein n=1 Tax=Rubritalea marina TaxID=361055 RepID=UPI0012E9B4B1|nr:hypothetical protein [Rubritalea marina]
MAALLLSAICRLAPRGFAVLSQDLTLVQWVALALFAIFMLHAEGYRGFQKKFSPRTAARVHYLYHNTTPLRALLAPLFCVGYFDASKKTRIVSTCLTIGIILLIMVVRYCPEPWRGIIDFGVTLGLSYGLASYIVFLFKVFSNKDHGIDPEMPKRG